MKFFLAFCTAIVLPFFAFAQADLTMVDVFPVNYLRPGTSVFSITLKNIGPVAVSTFKVGWQIDNGTPTEASTLTPLYPVYGGYVTRATGNFTVTFATPGVYKLKVWARAVSATDNNHANDTIVKTVKVISNLPEKRVLFEVFKHQACCPCVPAADYSKAYIDTMDNYFYVNLYNGSTDVLFNAGADSVNDEYGLAHPAPVFDRYKFPWANEMDRSFYTMGNDYILEDVGEREKFLEPAGVSFKSVQFNATTRELTVKVAAQFLDTISGDYRFNLYLAEDSVLAWQGCGVPDPNNYYHMKVLRHMAGGPWGQPGSLPPVIYPGPDKEYTFTYTIPAAYKLKHLHLVALVQKYSPDNLDRKIVNSIDITFNNALTLSASGPVRLQDDISIYPNPATQQFTVQLPGSGRSATVNLYDVSGKKLVTKPIRDKADIDLSNTPAGLYVVEVIADGASWYGKIIKE